MAAMQLCSCFSLDAGTETVGLLERRTRAGHRSLKQGQLEVVGRGRRQLNLRWRPHHKSFRRELCSWPENYGQKGHARRSKGVGRGDRAWGSVSLARAERSTTDS
jgi:hypothetical protein